MPEENKKLEFALLYAKLGIAVIPCHTVNNGKCSCNDLVCPYPGKHPRTKNGPKDATTNEVIIKEWWRRMPNSNIGGVTGAISGIIVLDLDTKHGKTVNEMLVELSEKGFIVTPTVSSKTGAYLENRERGNHFFFKHPGIAVKNGTNILKEFGINGVDRKGDGGMVIMAPSDHFTGVPYEWVISPEGETTIENLADMPNWLPEPSLNKKSTPKWLAGKDGVSEGSRNDTATSMAGKIISSTVPELQEEIGWPQLQTWNIKNTDKDKKPNPLPENELRSIWERVKKMHLENKSDQIDNQKNTKAQMIIDLIEGDKNITLFHSDVNEPFVRIPINGHYEIWSCKSRQFTRWIRKIIWEKSKVTLNGESLATALGVIEGKACFDNKEYILNNRIAWFDNAIWYDLSDKDWRAIRIAEDGWSIIDNPPILFSRFNHQKTQVIPTTGGIVDRFLDYINISNENLKILLKVYLISCFIPNFPHPIAIFYGRHGSAKSTASRIFKKTTDPSTLETLSFPKNKEELTQMLSHHWSVFFDNVSFLSQENSDALCRAVTGAGSSKRQLYSDDDDIICSFKRCIGLNGIDLVAKKSDLLDRSILIELEKIPDNKRREEQEILASFESDLPQILGSIFDSIVIALRVKKEIKVDSLKRMADFTIWGCAIAESLGYTHNQFIEAYRQNIESQNREVLYNNPVAALILCLMKTQDTWIGTASSLLTEMKSLSHSLEIDEKLLPKAGNVLSKWINQLKPNLEEFGISITHKDGEQRILTIQKSSKKVEKTPVLVNEDKKQSYSSLDAFCDAIKLDTDDSYDSSPNINISENLNIYELESVEKDEDGIEESPTVTLSNKEIPF